MATAIFNRECFFITGNVNKAKEVQDVFGDKLKIKALSCDILEVQNTDVRFVAFHKCSAALDMFPDRVVIVDDSSVELETLGGMPGQFIKHFEETLGYNGIYKMLNSFPNKSATAVCVLCIGYKNEKGENVIGTYRGLVHGKIVTPAGFNGFGWDTIFKPDDSDITYAEMSEKEKNDNSPRKKAAELMYSDLVSGKCLEWRTMNADARTFVQFKTVAVDIKNL